MKEIDWRIRAIIDRTNLSKSFQARLHNMEINIPKTVTQSPAKVETTIDQDNAITQAFEAAKARKTNGKR